MPEHGQRTKLASKARRLLLVMLLGMAVGAHAASPCDIDPGGIGGTGSPHGGRQTGRGGDSEGIGGTGASANSEGIGGTGIKSTGIVGRITGFGSICVNGLEVHYSAQTPVEADGVRVGASALAIGQVVAVEGTGGGRELRARRIALLYEIAGVVTNVDAPAARISVMGQPVDVRDIRFVADSAGGRNALSALSPGDFVRVSGLRRADGTVVASLVSRGGAAKASVMGLLSVGRKGVPYSVSGVRIELAGGASVPDGSHVRVSGRWDGRALKVQTLDLDPVRHALGRVERLELEGYVQHSARSDAIRVGSNVIELDARTRFSGGTRDLLAEDPRVRIGVRVTPDSRMVAERVMFEHDTGHLPRGTEGSTPAPARDGRGPGGGGAPPKDNGGREQDQGDRSLPLGTPASDAPIAGRGGLESAERVEQPDRAERSVKPEPLERPEPVERPERPERPEAIEKPERPERPERVERPEKVERPERPERVERPEKVERLEKPERH